MEETPTLEIYVMDTVSFGDSFSMSSTEVSSPYFQPEFRFTIDKDVSWAPARSRAPSVKITFELSEMGGFS
jgi:hypothetical protein